MPSSDNDASEPAMAAATSVRASSPGVRRRAGSTSWVGSAIAGPPPGPPWFSLDSVVASRAVSLMARTVPRELGRADRSAAQLEPCRFAAVRAAAVGARSLDQHYRRARLWQNRGPLDGLLPGRYGSGVKLLVVVERLVLVLLWLSAFVTILGVGLVAWLVF